MAFYVGLTELRVLAARWRREAEELRAGTRGHEMDSNEALSVAAQLEECAEQLEHVYATRQVWTV